MKKKLHALLILSTLLLFSACTGEPSAPPSAPPAAPPGNEEPDRMTFTLTPTEQDAYDRIQTDKDEAHLEGLEPVSVAKLYIQALLDEDYETEYALYFTENVSEGAGWTLEDHLEIPESHRATQDEIYEVLVPLVDGEFIPSDSSAGYIRYQALFHDTDETMDMGFQMRRKQDGVWKVFFLPLQ